LRYGRGGCIDLIKARKYYKLSADLGNITAQYNYACMVRNGEGGYSNLEEARRYTRFASDGGNTNAQLYYGRYLLNESIMPNTNYRLAYRNSGLKLIKNAADKGNIIAIIHYGNEEHDLNTTDKYTRLSHEILSGNGLMICHSCLASQKQRKAGHSVYPCKYHDLYDKL